MKDTSKILIATSLGHFINDGLSFIFPVVYPLLLLAPFYLSTFSIGILGAVLSLFSIVTSPFIGRRSDVGRNFGSLLSIGIIIIVLGTVGFSFSMGHTSGNELLLALALSSAIIGLGSSFYHPIGAALLNETWALKNRAFAMGINGSMGTAGIVLMPIIANLAIVSFGITSLDVIGGAGIVIALLIYLLIKRTSLLKLDQQTSVSTNEISHTGSLEKEASSLKFVLMVMLPLTLVSFFRGAFFGGITQFLPVYLYNIDHIPYALVAVAISVVAGAGIFSQPLFGRSADRYDLRAMIAFTSIGGIISIAVFMFSANFAVDEISLGLFGAFQFTAFPLLLALASQIAPKKAVTLSNSIVWGLGNVGGGTVGPLLVGALSSGSLLGSLASAFQVLMLIGLVGLVFVPFIRKPPKLPHHLE